MRFRLLHAFGTVALVLPVLLLAVSLAPSGSAADAAAKRTYVGSGECQTCHPDIYRQAEKTAHNKKTQPASRQTLVMPVNNRVTTTADGNAMFKLRARGKDEIYLALYDLDGSNETEYRVSRVMGGGSTIAGKQRLIISVGEDGDSVARSDGKVTNLISPVQFNHLDTDVSGDDAFNAYHPEHWYNSDGTLIGGGTSRVSSSQFKNSWERRCVGCHATGAAVTYDRPTGMFLNESSEFNVKCEACHGPGSEHVASADPGDIVNPAEMSNTQRALDVCARCHIRGSNVGEGQFSTGYPAKVNNRKITFPPFGALLADWYTPGEGVWNSNSDEWGPAATVYNNSKKHHQQGFDYIQSTHWTSGEVKCWDCHETHNRGVGRGQLVARDDDNSLCLSCHADTYPDEASITAHTKHSYNPVTTGASRCTSCHMPRTAKSQQWWFDHSGDIASHTFEVIKPKLTDRMAGRSGSVGAGSAIPNGCNGCHMDADNGVARWNRWKAARTTSVVTDND